MPGSRSLGPDQNLTTTKQERRPLGAYHSISVDVEAGLQDLVKASAGSCLTTGAGARGRSRGLRLAWPAVLCS